MGHFMENCMFIYMFLLLTNPVSSFEKHIYKNLAAVFIRVESYLQK